MCYVKIDLNQLRQRLIYSKYTTTEVLSRIGEAGQSGLRRNCTIPTEWELGDASDAQATLIKLWLLQSEVPEKDLINALTRQVVCEMVSSDILQMTSADRIKACLDIRPYESADDEASGWIVSDLMPGLNTNIVPTRHDYVLGVSPASTTLAQMAIRTPVNTALDLGTGSGVQSLHLAKHCREVVATDINQRALRCAQLTAELNQVKVDFRCGSLYEPVKNNTFDLILTNPPYVMAPPKQKNQELTYRETGFIADDLVKHLITQAPQYLNPAGSLQVLANWAVTANQPWQERLREWVTPTGCDVWVIERERLDVYAYIEMWLTDAGMSSQPGWKSEYQNWLRYFEKLNIESVGMGWILLTKAGRNKPNITIESWPHAVQQPVGKVFAQHQKTVDLAELNDAQLLEKTLKISPQVNQETIGQPGASDPNYIVLRQTTGLLRAMKVDTYSAAVFGACDGDLPVKVLISSVAQILNKPVAEIVQIVMPQLRQAINYQILFNE